MYQSGKRVFGDLPVEIRNQARVHLWHKDRFGTDKPIAVSTEDAISRWMSPTNSIGVKLQDDDSLSVFAAQGLFDVMHLIVRPNRQWTQQDSYERKIARWKSIWPMLTIESW